MCILFVYHTSQDSTLPWKLVVASNRDERLDRPATPAHWWTDAGPSPPILAGQDSTAGGTWFGVTLDGRLAVLTNQRVLPGVTGTASAVAPPPLRSRGHLLLNYLQGQRTPALDAATAADIVAQQVVQIQTDMLDYRYNGYNLLLGDLVGARYSMVSKPSAVGVPPHVTPLAPDTPHCVSNADFPAFSAADWPKIIAGQQQFGSLIQHVDTTTTTEQSMLRQLFTLLSNTTLYGDQEQVIQIDRQICVPLITIRDVPYATRVSTVLLVDRQDRVVLAERLVCPTATATSPDSTVSNLIRISSFQLNSPDSIATADMLFSPDQ